MPKYKSNHYVPRAIIARFSEYSDQPGRVWFWDRESTGPVEFRNPKSVHASDYLYARWDPAGVRDSSAEHALSSEIDSVAPVFLDKIIARNNTEGRIYLTDSERAFCIKLVIRTIVRNPATLQYFNEMWLTRLAKFFIRLSRRLGAKSSSDEAYRRYGLDRVLQGEVNHLATTIDLDPHLEDYLRLGIHFWTPEGRARNFVLGSQPYLLKPRDKASGLLSGEVYLVLHPRLMVGLLGDKDSEYINTISEDEMKRINGLFVKYSAAIAAARVEDVLDAWYYPNGEEGQKEVVALTKRG